MKPFPKRDVTVTLTGEEWTTLLARMINRELSAKGAKVYRQATTKLQQQILAQSEQLLEEQRSNGT
jgi:hypothetical protein